MPSVSVITGPSYEPILLSDVQAHCNIDATEDGIEQHIETVFIPVARDYVEWRTGRTIHEKTLELVLDRFPCESVIELPGATPLIELVSMKYTDSDGSETTWGASNYVTATGARNRLGRVAPAYGVTWPSFTPYPLDAVKIRYRAGIANASPVTEADADVKYAASLLVAGMYENRESEVLTDRAVIQAISMSYGVEAFLARLTVAYAF